MATADKERTKVELQRRYRVSDMMITMHSMLGDSYKRKTVALDVVIFASSIVIATLSFGDPNLIDWLPLKDDSTRLVIGSVAILTFLASLLAWIVDWNRKAGAHGRAASAYADAKFRLRSASEDTDPLEVSHIFMQYEEVSRNAVPIPDTEFLRLKSEHLLKIRLSRLLDRSPAASIRLARIRLRLRHTKMALVQDHEDT